MIKYLTPLVLILAGSVHAQTYQHLDSLAFTMPFNGASPLPQVVNVTSTGASLTTTATPSTATGGNWLSVSPTGFCCHTPFNIQVIVTAPVAPLAPGPYTGQVVFSSGNVSLTVMVTLTVTAPTTPFFDNLPGGLSFTGTPGSPSFTSQTFQVRNAGAGTLTWNLCATTFDSPTCNTSNWLNVSTTSGTAPSFVTVGITTAKLPGGGLTAGVFTGTLTLTGGGENITLPITVTIGASVFEQTNGLNFTKVFGKADPLDQIIQVASVGAAAITGITVTAASATGGNWLQVLPDGFCCNVPAGQAILDVSVNPAVTLAAGTYTAQIYLTNSLTNAIVIPVTLTIVPGAAPIPSFLDNMPGQLSFTLLTDGPNPPAQTIQVRDGGSGTLNWTALSSTFNNAGWLTVTPVSGTAPGFVTVQINVASLPNQGLVAGQFTGQILFQDPDSSVTVPVSVVVGTSVFQQVNGITFTKPLNSANNPLPQVIPLTTSTGSAITGITVTAISATGGNWLQVAPENFCCNTPAGQTELTISATPDITLAAGTYTGEVTAVTSTQAITIPVTLIIADPSTAFFSDLPGQLSYTMTVSGLTPPSQLVQIRNGGAGSLNWTAAAITSDGGNWLNLSATSGSAPTDVIIGITPASLPFSGLAAGRFTGSVAFVSGNNTATIPISVTVGGNSFAQINPIFFTMTATGPNPLPQILTVTSIGAAAATGVTVTAFTATGGNWLTVAPSGFICNTPCVSTISVNAPVTLGAGTYTGEIEYNNGVTAMMVPVTLTVASATAGAVPTVPVFDNVQGGMSFSSPLGGLALTSQTIQLRNAGPGQLNWTAVANTSDGGNWLTVSSPSGSAPATVTIGVVPQNLPNQALVAETATGQILFRSSAGNITVPVSVQLGPNVFVQQAPLTFSKNFGAGSPLTQPVMGSSAGTSITYTATASAGNGGNWLGIAPSGLCCHTPEANTVSVTAPAPFPSGAYTGQVLFNSTTAMAMIVPVYLNVQGGPPALSITKTHSGSFTQGGTGTYTVTVSNSASAGPTNGTVTVTDNAPTGLTVTAMSGAGWTCTTLPTCTTSGGLNAGQSFAPITVTVSVASNAPASLTNQATVSGGGSASNIANDTTTIVAATNYPAFFNGQDSLGGGVYYLKFPDGNVFGYYNFQGYPPIFYSYNLGFEAFIDGGSGAAYLYDFTSGHWWYTNPSLFPNLYDFTLNNWLFYFYSTSGPRYFSDLTTGKIISF
jgi:hypothetical protein